MEEWKRTTHRGSIPPEDSLILTAIIPTPRDLEIARVLGWYRIPFKFAPKIVYVDYLAFYQPGIFGEKHAYRIETFASVKGVELTKRREIIRDEPQHPRADEEYYKIQLGDLIALENPILAGKWKRITFLYTTGSRFEKAKVINDLVVRSNERKILWRSLRERAESFIARTEPDWEELELDENILIMLGELHRIREQPDWYQDQ
ncbi:MAG: hypothetical protein J7L66_03000 [Anaerolineaceae bacterium]|nr:hypothetical protein [Anaerolineaceae bacterium]